MATVANVAPVAGVVRPAGGAVLALGMALVALPARAGVLDDPHVGGIGFSGPTTGDLAAVHWNPAALAKMQGNHFRLTATFISDTASVARSSIDPSTGRVTGAGGRSFPEVDGTGNVQPLSLPLGPGTFLGLGVDVGSRFTLAIAGYTPSFQRIRFQPTAAGALPTRYHAVEVDLRNFALVPALGFRVGRRLSLGIAPGFLFPSAKLVFEEDTVLAQGQSGSQADCQGAPCGHENPLAAARYQLGGDFETVNANAAFTLSAGLLYEFEQWSLGASYTSRPLTRDNAGVEVDIPNSTVTLPPRSPGGAVSLCQGQPGSAAGGTDPGCVNGRIGYSLPHVITVGAQWNYRPRWTFTATGRYLTFSSHDDLKIRIAGPSTSDLGTPGLPDRIVIKRGFHDVVELRGGVIHALTEGVRLMAGLRASTGAVPRDHVNAGAVDGLTIEPAVAASLRFSWLSLAAGYALALVPPFSVGADESVFDPSARAACADSARDISTPACQTDLVGAARATAAGRYSRITHAFTLSATAHF